MRRRFLASFLVLAACGAAPSSTTGSADADHTAGDFVRYNSPYTWVATDYPTFVEAYQSISFWGVGATPLPDDHPLAVRLQTWLDRLDATVRASFEMRNGAPLLAPKPIVKVLPTPSTFNAWVSPLPACTGAPLGPIAIASNDAGAASDAMPSFDPDAGAPLDDAGALVPPPPPRVPSIGLMGGDTVMTGTWYKCVHPAEWSRDGFVSFWNASGAACRLDADGAGGLRVSGKTCQNAGATADDLGSFATTPYIHVTTDLIASVEEKTMAVILAHELGHYYRGHVTPAVRHKYNFWFDRDPHQAKTPVPSANAVELEKTYREIAEGPKPVGGAAIKSRYSARLRPYLLQGLAPLLTARTEPDFVCAKARDALGPWTAELLASDGVPSEDARGKFLGFESALAECAPKVALGAEPGAAALSLGSVMLPALQLGPRGASLHLGDGLAQWLESMNARAKKLDDKAAQLVKHLEQNRIGVYTIEQEADDIAIELATRLGISNDEVLAAWLDFMGAIDKAYDKAFFSPEEQKQYREQNAELTAVECKALLDAEFTQTDASGAKKAVFVRLGNLAEPHHASCYRLYNLWREKQVHKYPTGAAQPELQPAWHELKAEAAKLSQQE
jgi:hypothetical protein